MTELLGAFGTVLDVGNLLALLVGVLAGTLIGVLPGVGPAATVGLLLPFMHSVPPQTGLILLAGIYYGAQYGGSTTSILLNVPGESASVVTCLDGYPLARQGKAGYALAAAAIGSFIAGTIGLILFTLAAAPLAWVGLAFGPPEQATVMLVALVVAGSFGESWTRGLIAGFLGLLLSFVGADRISGVNRFVFDIPYLHEGIVFVPAAVGLFAVGEVFWYLAGHSEHTAVSVPRLGIRDVLPPMKERISSLWAMMRGSVIGFFVGILPGAGSVPASFLSYSIEKRLSSTPERFGRGALEGVAAPEAANNSAVIGALLPMFSLGIPGSAVTAMLLAGLMIWGLQPGPLLMVQHPEVVWPVIASLYVANVMLLVVNLPGAVLLAQISRVEQKWLMPGILALSLVGSYASVGSAYGPFLAIMFGFVAYGLRQGGYPMAPLLLGLILGPEVEQGVRRALIMAHGSPAIFVTRPICLALWGLMILLLVGSYLMSRSRGLRVEQQPEPSPGIEPS